MKREIFPVMALVYNRYMHMVIVGIAKNEWFIKTDFEFVNLFSVREPEPGGLVWLLGGLSGEK